MRSRQILGCIRNFGLRCDVGACAMRKTAIVAVLTVVASMGLGMPTAVTQTAPAPDPQARQSLPPPSTTGRAQPQAPVGHRQPRAADVPRQGEITIGPDEIDLDRKLQICRGC